MRLNGTCPAFAAAALVTAAAAASPLPELVPALPNFGAVVGADMTPGLVARDGGGGGDGDGGGGVYTSRGLALVYAAGSSASDDALGAGSNYIVEDVSFVPGPWARPQVRNIAMVQWQLQCAGWTAGPTFPQTNTPRADFDVVFEFWNSGDFSLAPSMLGDQTAPFAVRLTRVRVGTGFGWTVIAPMSTPVTIPADNCWVGIRYVQAGSYGIDGPGTRLFDGSEGSANPPGESATLQLVNHGLSTLPNSVGSTTSSLGIDVDGDLVFRGSPSPGGPPNERLAHEAAPSLAFAGDALPCGSADFNGDGDTGTDLDIEAFFACLGGNCCQSCGSADFNGDGDTGTELDVEAFFSVLGGGSC